MVQFHEQIITELLEDTNGGLVILSSGLALCKLISSFISLHHSSQGSLLILSASLSQKSQISYHLLDHAAQNPNPNSDHPVTVTPAEITSDLPAQNRYSLYSSGGVSFITSRILIVDLLTSKLPTSLLAGVVILNAHLLSETCTEAFIVRIVRSLNKNVCVRAFSDRPQAMVSGFAKAERIMKSLFIRKLHLWPRFQVYVSQELESDPPEVVDIRIPMSKYMMGIQKAIIEVMDACLKEMRKTNKVDVEDLTVENGLFKSFDEIVRKQLDPIWHTLGKKTKQLVTDLKTLRKLLDYLVRYDAVTYLKYLDSLRASESFRSVWIFAESSYKIFDYAKKRVYRLMRSDGVRLSVVDNGKLSKKRKVKDINNEAIGEANSNVTVEEVLEEPPKWKVLRDVLEEIEQHRQQKDQAGEDHSEQDSGYGTVLVACKDERTCMQLEDSIKHDPSNVMHDEWEKYLLSKVELQSLNTRKKKDAKQPKGIGMLNGVAPVTVGQNSEGSIINKQERDALLAAASRFTNLKKIDTDGGDVLEKEARSGGIGRGRGRGKSIGKSSNGSNTRTRSKKREADNLTAEDMRNRKPDSEEEQKNETEMAAVSGFTRSTEGKYSDKPVLRQHSYEAEVTDAINAKPLPPIHFHALETQQEILDFLKPSVIIVYHPDMTFVREIEVYKAENPSIKVKVYFLFYEDSTEVQKFEASIRRENSAFESLIRQKSIMMIPIDQEEQCLGLNSAVDPLGLSLQNSVTRKAGGRKDAEKEMQVIVDMREFMSSLPNVLHQKGMRIIPVTLEVGDYILSPLICVERKSIQDLFMSFASGRLYHQAEMMTRYYRIPVLLIEFSQDKSFSFQSASDIGDDVTPYNITSKLSLLVLHFPRLRILWSRSLHATAEIFASLKANQDEPDLAKATRVGVPSENGIVESDVRY
uniref:ERCC4 domain-containing protein n=1 Tax=Kalanchoe fedtschenkoi TaxID=63787 RepID=A0A7N0VF28_KALFE